MTRAMRKRELPEQALLLRLLRYEPETGKLYWRERTPDLFRHCQNPQGTCNAFNAQFAGREAFTASMGGYRHGTIFRKTYPAHRIIWKMETGEEPPEVMRLKGAKSDNRLANLKGVQRREGNRNAALRKDNSSGVAGVCWHKATNKWIAWICERGRKIHLGLFGSLDEARSVRAREMSARGYHPGHGRKAMP